MEIPHLNETEILILSVISPGELYGLEIRDEVKSLTSGKREISLGGLYVTLGRMEKKGLVTARWGDATEERLGARRRYYKITGLGASALREAKEVLTPAFKLRLNPGRA
jgi:DNA-binding PadR family transcriptional regulator